MTATVIATPPDIALYIYRGDSFAMSVGLWNGTAPVDLTGASAVAQIRLTPDDPEILASFACSIVDNYVNLVLDKAVTATLPPRVCWDAEITYADGYSQTFGFGPIAVTPDVTR